MISKFVFIICHERERHSGCCFLDEHSEDYNVFICSILTTMDWSNLRILSCFLHVNRSTKGLRKFSTVQWKFSLELVTDYLVLRLLALPCQKIYRELIL